LVGLVCLHHTLIALVVGMLTNSVQTTTAPIGKSLEAHAALLTDDLPPAAWYSTLALCSFLKTNR
jgi:hypothetical protein